MKKLVGFVGALLLLVICSPVAQAAIQLTYTIDANPTVTCTNAVSAGPVSCANVTTGPVLITNLSGSSNSAGTPTLALEQGTVLQIQNTGTASHSLTITLDSQDFTAPTAPPALTFLSHIGGTAAQGVAGSTLSFQSCVDPTNSLTACAGPSQHSGLGTPIIGVTGSFSDDKTGSIASLTGPYSISETINLVLAAGEILNLSTSTTLLSAVPEPTSVALFGTVLGGAVLALRKKLYKRA